MLFWWNRIITFAAPRMATCDSFNREPASFEKPVDFQGFQSIMRTSRVISAVFPQPRRNGKLIKLYQSCNWKNQNLVQHNSLSYAKIIEKRLWKSKLTNNNSCILNTFIFNVNQI